MSLKQRKSHRPLKVLITSGVRMFHLPYLAAALDPLECNYKFLMGLYPTHLLEKILRLLPPRARVKVLSRGQKIPDSRVYLALASEVLAHMLQLSRQLRMPQSVINLLTRSLHYTFAYSAYRIKKRMKPDIYHYRCSYGLFSLRASAGKNCIKLCDHSIAHPYLVDLLIQNQGLLPGNNSFVRNPSNELVNDFMNLDIEQSDHIVVNSEFVKKSLVRMGINAAKISVIELAVEEKFFTMIADYQNVIQKRQPNHILYAGSWIPRKGVDTLVEAVAILDGKVSLRIAGTSDREFNHYCRDLKLDISKIVPLGYLNRKKLCQEMLRSKIFVFPSLCEGFAKTVQEAMACGCYIIATENSGFSTRDGAHGIIVSPGKADELAFAVMSAISNPLLDDYCQANRAYAMKNFSSASYSNSMCKLYRKLIDESELMAYNP
jgi:glycosyltransferase involved in cell wall biosynthesis